MQNKQVSNIEGENEPWSSPDECSQIFSFF